MDIYLGLFAGSSPFFIGLLALIVILCLYFHFFAFSSGAIEIGPPILTSLGIFGTFLGVAIGLMEFNTQNIQASVPPLIEGLKTAFWSSIIGLFCAVTIKLRFAFSGLRNESDVEPEMGVEDIAKRLDLIYQALVGDNSVRTEIAHMGLETSDQLKQIENVIESYQDRMVRMNTDALVEALDTLMRDFNTKINEQYGDNFKKFNHSVKLILIWQRQHKEQIQDFTEKQQIICDTLSAATKSYESLVSRSEAFSTVAETLSEALSALDYQSESLATYIQKMASAVEQASEGLPRLEERIGDLTDQLSVTVLDSTRLLTQSMQKNSDNIEQTLQVATHKLSDSVQSMHNLLGQHVLDIVKRSEHQISVLDGALEAELNKALVTLGAQLAALSEKFVHDYTPLTDRLREIVRLAEVNH